MESIHGALEKARPPIPDGYAWIPDIVSDILGNEVWDRLNMVTIAVLDRADAIINEYYSIEDALYDAPLQEYWVTEFLLPRVEDIIHIAFYLTMANTVNQHRATGRLLCALSQRTCDAIEAAFSQLHIEASPTWIRETSLTPILFEFERSAPAPSGFCYEELT